MILAYTEGARWEPGIGDPTFMGWFTVAAYFATSLLCGCAAWAARPSEGKRWSNVLFWAGAAVFLFGLGINKQLDLQTWFTLTGKNLALRQGWYEDRRGYQALFIAFVMLTGVTGMTALVWSTRGNFRQLRLALLGLAFLGCFIVVRAASFHNVDQMLGFRIGGAKVNWILEVGGIAVVGLGALQNLRRPSAAPQLPVEGVRGETFIWISGRVRGDQNRR
jgi:hypothetical protein